MKEIISLVMVAMWGVLVFYLAKTLKKNEESKKTKVLIGTCSVLALAGLIYVCSDSFITGQADSTSEINMASEVIVVNKDTDDTKRIEVDYNEYKKVFEDELRVIKDDILTYKMFIEYCSDKIEYTEEEFEEYMKEAFEYTYGESDDMESIAKKHNLDFEFIKLLYLESFSRELYLDKIIEDLDVKDDEVLAAYEKDAKSYHYADLIYISCESEEVVKAAVKMIDTSGLEGLEYLEGVEVIDTTVNLYDHGLDITVDDPELINVLQSSANPETGEYYLAVVSSINTTAEDCFEHTKGHLLEEKANEALNSEITEFYHTLTVE